MNVQYDSDADAMYIVLKEADVDSTKELDINTIADFDSAGEIIGLELLFVKERHPELLSILSGTF